MLPRPLQMRVGAVLGRLLYLIASRRRHIAAVNLKLCFPELSDDERNQLLKRHFAALGISLLETGNAWWCPHEKIKMLVANFNGADYVRAALASGRSVLLIGAHFTTLEISNALFRAAFETPISIIYRPHENPEVDWMYRHQRERHTTQAIARDDMRSLVKLLRQNAVVWYAPDQNYGLKNSVFAPFFGVPAATNTSATRLARSTGCVVIPFVSKRLADNRYEINMLPPFENFPSEDPQADATQINLALEKALRGMPEQYLWVHRRFKDRPPGERDVYAR